MWLKNKAVSLYLIIYTHLLLVAPELEVGLTLAAGIGFAGVLGVVEDQHVARRSLRRNHARILGHIPGNKSYHTLKLLKIQRLRLFHISLQENIDLVYL